MGKNTPPTDTHPPTQQKDFGLKRPDFVASGTFLIIAYFNRVFLPNGKCGELGFLCALANNVSK